eukprot:COSAG03_NODE_161_length_11325_cov_3.659362_7_plen_77_part_00
MTLCWRMLQSSLSFWQDDTLTTLVCSQWPQLHYQSPSKLIVALPPAPRACPVLFNHCGGLSLCSETDLSDAPAAPL